LDEERKKPILTSLVVDDMREQVAHRIEYRRARLEDNRLIASNADELGENLKGVDRVGKNCRR